MQMHHLLNMPDFIIGQVLEGPTWLSCRQCDLVYMSGWWLSPTPRKKKYDCVTWDDDIPNLMEK